MYTCKITTAASSRKGKRMALRELRMRRLDLLKKMAPELRWEERGGGWEERSGMSLLERGSGMGTACGGGAWKREGREEYSSRSSGSMMSRANTWAEMQLNKHQHEVLQGTCRNVS